MKQLSLSWLLFTSILIIIVITVSIMGGMWIYDTQIHSQIRSDDMVESLMSSYKATLRQTVMSEVEHITYKKTHTEEILKKSIKDRTYEAYDIASSIYKTYRDSKSEAYIKDSIVETLRHITFNNGRGYYFIDNLQGDVILYPGHPELEGGNIWNLKDQNGHFVIQEEIDLIKTSKEGFIEGYWEKPDSLDRNEYKKITFIKSFEPYDWYIGCGEYVEDVKKDVQNEVLNYFNQLQFGEDSESYIFIHDLSGIELANGRYPEMVGENNYNLKNFEGIYIVREQIDLVQDEQEGFLVHGWVDKGVSFHKLTYVYLIPEWNWVVGSSLNLTEIQDLIDLEQTKLDLRKKDQLFKITFIALLSIGICIIIVKYLTSYVKKSVETVHHTVDHAIDQLETIEADKLTFTDFTPLIHKTNEMTQTISSLMHIDPLTSLYNKKYLVKQVEGNHYSKRNQSLILIDIDHFNRVNEKYGTNVGDDVLKNTANLLKQIVDTSGIVGRYSGQQFLIVLPNTSREKARSIAEVITKRLFTFNFIPLNERITISGSVVWDDYTDISETFEKLEAIVYKAKKLGRNQILTN